MGEPLASNLADFCAVYYGVEEIKVIRRAVEEHIERRLAEDTVKKEEFEARRKRRLASDDRRHLRPVND